MTQANPEQIADRIAIEQVLARYCRGIDRCDPDELAAVFAEDAQIDFGDGAKPRDETISGLMAGLGAMRLTQHNIGNVICEVDGSSAMAETNCAALHIVQDPDSGGEIELVVGGRYLDHLAKRNGQWQIIDRRYIMDWNRQGPASMLTSGGLYDTLLRHGARKPEDPSYAWWQQNPEA